MATVVGRTEVEIKPTKIEKKVEVKPIQEEEIIKDNVKPIEKSETSKSYRKNK